MSEMGSIVRHIGDIRVTSAFPLKTVLRQKDRHVRFLAIKRHRAQKASAQAF
jgi:hypothetical protein